MADIKVTLKSDGLSGSVVKAIRNRVRVRAKRVAMMEQYALREGVDHWSTYVSTHPTPWMAANEGKTGRVETGAMRDALVLRDSGSAENYTGALILPNVDYYTYQDQGVAHAFGNPYAGPVQGLFAVRDTKQYVENLLRTLRTSL